MKLVLVRLNGAESGGGWLNVCVMCTKWCVTLNVPPECDVCSINALCTVMTHLTLMLCKGASQGPSHLLPSPVKVSMLAWLFVCACTTSLCGCICVCTV